MNCTDLTLHSFCAYVNIFLKFYLNTLIKMTSVKEKLSLVVITEGKKSMASESV